MTGSLASLDYVWQSPGFATWLALIAAVLFGLIVLVTMLRVERTVANAALAVITLAAFSIAVSVSMRGNGESASVRAPSSSAAAPVSAAIAAPALACVDDLAGDIVLAACERVLFGSADSAAAAVSYAASKISQLTAHGNVAAVNGTGTGEVAALRRLVERDRYGLMAYVLMARDQCQPEACAAFASLSDRSKLVVNMEERTYAGMIARYAPTWNAPSAALVPAVVSSLPPSVPTGKPTNAEFPTSNSIPPINIMTPEPPLAGVRAPAAPTAAKKPAAQPKARPPAQAQPPQAAPVQLAPQAGRADN